MIKMHQQQYERQKLEQMYQKMCELEIQYNQMQQQKGKRQQQKKQQQIQQQMYDTI